MTTAAPGLRVPNHTYAPRGSARQLFECREGEVLVSGPAGTGKSRACLEKIHFICMLNPGARALIVRKTLASLGSTALATWRKYVVPEAMAVGDVDYYGGSSEEPPQYRYTNGSVVVIGGMDRAIRIMSSEYDVIYVQEAIELGKDDWEYLFTRLRNGVVSFQQLLADANPDAPTHWLKQRCEEGRTVMLDSRHEENPVYFADDGTLTDRGRDYMSKLDNLTGVRRMRLRLGLWVAAEGIIYDNYDPVIHKLPARFAVPDDWTRIWSVDFGYKNPFVWQLWALDPDGRLYLVREIYHTERTVDQHARDIMDVVAPMDPDYVHDEKRQGKQYAHHGRRWVEPRPLVVICDHDAENRAVLEREIGMPTKAANKAVAPGIEAVQRRFRKAGDGKPRLYFLPDTLVTLDQSLKDRGLPYCTEQELSSYVWKPKPKISQTEKPEPDEPLKKDDHGMDAKRYVVAHLDLKNRPGIRWL